MVKDEFELEGRTCEALVLGFDPTNILIYDFYIPFSSRAQEIIRKAIPNSYGKNNFNLEEGRRELGDRLARGSYLSFFDQGFPGPYSDSYTYFTQFFLGGYLKSSQRMFSTEWFPEFGNISKFRAGEREKARKRVEAYFNKFELEKIERIQEAMKRVKKR
jgi:hypothetical protein